MNNLKTIGYIDLHASKPKIYKTVSQFHLVKDTRQAAQQTKREAFYKEATKRAYAFIEQRNTEYMSERMKDLQTKYSK